MSNRKDQAPNSPSQSTGLPIKKRDFAGIMPNYSSHDDFLLLRMNKKQKLNLLQQQAYFNVLHAFSAESPQISSPKILIVKDLMKEWNIDHKTHTTYENKIKTDPMVQQLRNVSLASDEKKKQIVIAAEEQKITGTQARPLTIRLKPKKEDMLKIRDQVIAPAKIQDEKVIAPAKIQDEEVMAPAKMKEEEAKQGSTSDDSPVPSWGQVSPGSLIGRWINIRMPGENDYISFYIKQYDSNTEMHYLVTALSKKDFEDPCNWIDLRHIPAEDIIWREGHPGLPVRKCFLEPGETLLLETSTARKKKQIKEVGKTSTGIPIIRKVDKGKSIVGANSPVQ